MTMRVYLAGLAYFAVYVLATELHRWLRIRRFVRRHRETLRSLLGGRRP